MSKRPALEPPEETFDAPSPASKRPRVIDEQMENLELNGDASNGHATSPRRQGQRQTNVPGAVSKKDTMADDSSASDEEQDDDDEPAISAPQRQSAPEAGYTDLYLDTIDRKVLDFRLRETMLRHTFQHQRLCMFSVWKILSGQGSKITSILPCAGRGAPCLRQHGN